MSATSKPSEWLHPLDPFPRRHLGSEADDVRAMLEALGLNALSDLIDQAVPPSIRTQQPLGLPEPLGEQAALRLLRGIAQKNQVFRSYLGMGYHDCVTPPVIQRNILENPGWYTQYTPYQSEISQGRLEALLNFQTLISDLTGLPLANASLLDEATAAAEAMLMCRAADRSKRAGFFVADDCHPQTIAVLRTRAEPLGVQLHVGPIETLDPATQDLFGALLQYPTTHGAVGDHAALARRLHDAKVLLVVATDLLALTLLRPPGEFGADVAIGSAQRFGVPMGYGGPHAAFLSTREEHKRLLPGRLVGVSKDVTGRIAYRLAIQTREQHIRRDKATSNICTAQVLLAIMASMYAVYHGPEGLRRIAKRVHGLTLALGAGLEAMGYALGASTYFDTLHLLMDAPTTARAMAAGLERQLNLRSFDGGGIGIALDETTTLADVEGLLGLFAEVAGAAVPDVNALVQTVNPAPRAPHVRTSAFLEHAVFHAYHSEHEMLRYIHRLQARDLSLTSAMIPLGSCTMKLNATAEMIPITWSELAGLHPFVPGDQARGYQELCAQLEDWLARITGFTAVSLQPNAGSQGEYAGLLTIRAYHHGRQEPQRDVCLIPKSAHGTNPATAVIAGFKVVVVACDERGNIDVADLRKQAETHRERLGALMITYPSTHGVFETGVREICEVVHAHGGQVYMDGANMNAQVGLCRPGEIGADVCHLNLHKTFCIPHGGGGPGMGPIAVAAHLAPYLPGHPVTPSGGERALGPVSAAAYGSAGILPISWMYIRMMGDAGLTRATEIAILNANYMASRLASHYPVLYTGEHGRVAHEFVLDARPFKTSAGVEVEDIAKRLMDFGFHAPTMSWPVPGTLMVEPTESESKAELDRFCDAMIAIREEIRAIEEGRLDRENNPLKRAPHTAEEVASDAWDRPYAREQAAFPLAWIRPRKFWPAVARVDNTYGDRNLMCTCPPPEAWA